MPEFTIDIPHAMTVEEASAKLNGAQDKLQQEYGLTCTWQDGDTMRVHRAGLDGIVQVESERLTVRVKLNFLMGAFSGKIQEGIKDKLTRLMQP